jgi:hypothetical protein
MLNHRLDSVVHSEKVEESEPRHKATLLAHVNKLRYFSNSVTNCDARGRWLEDWRLICGGIRVACYSTCGGYCSRLGLWRRLGLEGRRERRQRGCAHGRQERRVFVLISCLIRLIHLLSLNRENYLTLSKNSILSLNVTLMGLPSQPIRPGPLVPWHLTLPALFWAARPRAAAWALWQWLDSTQTYDLKISPLHLDLFDYS